MTDFPDELVKRYQEQHYDELMLLSVHFNK